jgi:hypothetical protein
MRIGCIDMALGVIGSGGGGSGAPFGSQMPGYGQYSQSDIQSQAFPPWLTSIMNQIQGGNATNIGNQIGNFQSLAQGAISGQQQAGGFQSALDFFTQMYGPGFIQNDINDSVYQGQIGALSGYQSEQTKLLNDQYQNALAGLGLQNQGIDVTQAGNLRTIDYYNHLQDLASQLLGVNQEDTKNAATTATRNVNSSATARGAFNAPGTGWQRDDIQSDLASTLQQLQLGYDKESAGYSEGISNLYEQNQMLDLQAQQLGLNSDQLRTQLDMGLARLGLDTTLSINDLMGKLASGSVQDQMLANQIFMAALQGSDYFTQFTGGGYSGGYSGPSGGLEYV